MKKLNEYQKKVYDRVMESIVSGSGGVFFVYRYEGTGKTFIWKTISTSIRSKEDIVLNVASSGIASLLLPGGRTAHSRFRIPLSVCEDSTCNEKQGSDLAQLLSICKLIIWDKAPMVNKWCIEALDKTTKDIMQLENGENSTKLFGGKTVVLGGDFRQVLPVIPKGTRQDVVRATINSSYIWDECTMLKLMKNMRLMSMGSTNDESELRDFTDWISGIGDGTLGTAAEHGTDVRIPGDILLECGDDPVKSIVDAIYPTFLNAVDDPGYLQERAILAPTLDSVNSINEYMISLNKNASGTYLSSDSACKSDTNVDILADVHTPEFLNSIKCSGMPNHELILKVGTPVMLLRNLDHARGLCNGTRLVITTLGDRVIQAKMMTGNGVGDYVLIPRLTLTPSDVTIPFKFQRRQFPLIVSYAMTINKSQGQSLKIVRLYLKRSIFSHGQLYVAVSKVTTRKCLKIMLCDAKDRATCRCKNVVFKEVFRNV